MNEINETIFKNEQRKIYGRKLLKSDLTWSVCKGYIFSNFLKTVPQILLGPSLNILSHIISSISVRKKECVGTFTGFEGGSHSFIEETNRKTDYI